MDKIGVTGIQETVDKIYKINAREELLNSFIKEAISKIEINKYYQSRNKLPPFPK